MTVLTFDHPLIDHETTRSDTSDAGEGTQHEHPMPGVNEILQHCGRTRWNSCSGIEIGIVEDGRIYCTRIRDRNGNLKFEEVHLRDPYSRSSDGRRQVRSLQQVDENA